MTLIRSAAVKVSGFVQRHASPGWDEWLAGLNREMDFIESDWKALGWAAGSLRVLLDRRPAPIRTYADLSDAAEKFAEGRRKLVGRSWLDRNSRFISFIIFALVFLTHYLRSVQPHVRLGYRLLIIGSLISAVGFLARRSYPDVPGRHETSALIRFYRDELRRISSFTSSGLWLPFGTLIVFAVGTALAIAGVWEGILLLPVYVLFTGVMLLILQSHRNNRRKLRQIATVLAERDAFLD